MNRRECSLMRCAAAAMAAAAAIAAFAADEERLIEPGEKVLDAVFDRPVRGCRTVNHQKMLSLDVGKEVLGLSAFCVSAASNIVKTGWGLRTPEFPVKGGRGFSVEISACGSLDMRRPRGNKVHATYISWLDAGGKELEGYRTFGLRTDPQSWTVTTVAGDVPQDACKAVVCIGCENDIMTNGDFVAISRITARTHPPGPAEENRVTVRDDGTVLVGGKPFFPIGIYAVDKKDFNGNDIRRAFRELRAAGFNFAHTYNNRRTAEREDFLAAADETGMKLWLPPGTGNKRFRETNIINERWHPSMLAWYLGDDTANAVPPDEVLRRHLACRTVDPAHITVQADYLARDRSHRFRPYVHCTDAFMLETYHVRAKNRTGLEVASVIRDMRTVARIIATEGAPVKSVWPIIQHFEGWSTWKRFPTFDELRAMSFAAIIHGAHGIVWYTYGGDGKRGKGVTSSPERWKEICRMAGEIASIQNDLTTRDAPRQPSVEVLDGPAQDACGQPSVTCLLKSTGLLMAVNAATNAVTARIDVKGSEGRVVSFRPYEVKVFPRSEFHTAAGRPQVSDAAGIR